MFIQDPAQLIMMERSKEPLAKFQAAEIYFATEHPYIAYQRIGEGFALAQLDSQMVQRISTAPMLSADASASLSEAVSELQRLLAQESLDANETLRVVQLRAQLGQHYEALSLLNSYLETTGFSPNVVKDFAASTISSNTISLAK